MAALTSGALTMAGNLFGRNKIETDEEGLPRIIRELKPLEGGVVPISVEERKQRIARAQQLMAQEKIDAIFMEGTTSSFYFTGMRWGQSERTFGLVIPAKGAVAYVCPKF